MNKKKFIVFFFISLIASKVYAETLFQDNFDSYSEGTFPSGWILKYGGSGEANQYIDNSKSKSSQQSLHLDGSKCWGVEAYHPVDFFVNSVNNQSNTIINFTVNVFIDQIVSNGCTKNRVQVGLQDPSLNVYGTFYGDIAFANDGFIYLRTNTYNEKADLKLMPYTAKTWYTVQTKINFDTKTADAYINGVLKASNVHIDDLNSSLPTGVVMTANHGDFMTAWFDDVYVSDEKSNSSDTSCTTISKWNLEPKNFPNKQVTLSCDTGYTAVSGGAECYDYGNWYGRLTKSFPNENGWSATCQRYDYNGSVNNEGAQTIKVMYVRCCK